jgi:hypothetical protein
LEGSSPDVLLDAYEVERERNVRAVIDFSMSLGRVICVSDPDEAAERDAFMAAAADADPGPSVPPPLPGIDAGVVAAGDPLAGQLFVQGRVGGADGSSVLLDDVVGAGWLLVAADAEARSALTAHDEAWFADRGGRVVAVDDLDDLDGTYADWFAEHGVVAALQRPDFHLFGSAATAADVPRLVGALRTTLADPTHHLAPTPGGEP